RTPSRSQRPVRAISLPYLHQRHALGAGMCTCLAPGAPPAAWQGPLLNLLNEKRHLAVIWRRFSTGVHRPRYEHAALPVTPCARRNCGEVPSVGPLRYPASAGDDVYVTGRWVGFEELRRG